MRTKTRESHPHSLTIHRKDNSFKHMLPIMFVISMFVLIVSYSLTTWLVSVCIGLVISITSLYIQSVPINKKIKFKTPGSIASYIWLILFVFYFISGWNGFLYLLIVYSFFIMSIFYIFYLEKKHNFKINIIREKGRRRSYFKVLLKNKNFLNHHNYYHSQKKQQIYERATRKKKLFTIVISSIFIPILFLLTGINELFSSGVSFRGVLSICGIGVILIFMIQLLKYIWYNSALSFQKSKYKIYQAKILGNKYTTYKNKLFFY